MQIGKTYTFKGSRIKNAVRGNMEPEGDAFLFQGNSFCFFKAIDGAEEQCPWGRLHLDYEAAGAAVAAVRIMASDSREIEWEGEWLFIDDFLERADISQAQKEKIFERFGCVCAESRKDVLLYTLRGRYLWLEICTKGGEDVQGKISSIKIYQKGDTFIDTFPEIYRERNDFFHRYLTIFSSIYNEFQDKIEKVPKLFCVDSTPKELLSVLAGWLGIDVQGDFLSEEQLRTLVKEAYELNKGKGTRKTLQRVAEITADGPVVIKERAFHDKEEKSDITILISSETKQDKKAGIMYLLQQFKPVKSSMRILFLRKNSSMDKDAYMDMNAVIIDGSYQCMDRNADYENIILK